MTSTLRFPSGLYGITPEWDDTQRLLDAVHNAYKGGMRVLQWRRKLASAELAKIQLEALHALCKELTLPLLINDNWELAQAMNTDGAHLGRDDGELSEARVALASPKYIGASCYNQAELAQSALEAGVDYIAFGAMFNSSVKPNAPRATFSLLQQGRALCDEYARNNQRAAVVAIGGITPENALEVIKAGADSIAVISSLFEAPNVYERAQHFSRLFTAH